MIEHSPIPESPDIKKLLLPREKYFEAREKQGNKILKLEISNNNQDLFYFGANHSPDPSNYQYPILETYWQEFLKKTEGKGRIILREGYMQAAPLDKEQAITWGAEGALTNVLSKEAGVPLASADLNSQEEVDLLGDKYKEEILLHSFLAYVNHWQRFPDSKPNFKKQSAEWFEYQRTRSVWSGINPSIERMEELYHQFTGKKFDENDPSINSLINPNNKGTRINEFSRQLSDLRDEHIVSEILRYWKEGKSIFVVFGSGHLIIQEPALRTLLR